MPTAGGPYSYVAQQIFDEDGPIDVLFLGDSSLWVGVDAKTVQADLSRALGRPARVRILASNWAGTDVRYWILRDLLSRRRVGLAVISLEAAGTAGADHPHVLAPYVIRMGEKDGGLTGLSVRGRLAAYAASVLGAPRALLSVVRRERPGPTEWDIGAELGGYPRRLGFRGAPFAAAPAPVAVPPAVVLDWNTQDAFSFSERPAGAYHSHFLRELWQFARDHGTSLAVLHVPPIGEAGSRTVRMGARWDERLGQAIPVLGLPAKALFSSVPPSHVLDYYYDDDHLNVNGRALFTAAVTPTIVALYLQRPPLP